MSRLIICTTGTSIAFRLPWQDGQEEAYRRAIRERITTLEQEQPTNWLLELSGETRGLAHLDLDSDGEVALLHTDTRIGQICAEELSKLIESKLQVVTSLHKIEGLQVTDAQAFRREGIRNLFETIQKLTRENSQSQITLNATGGFKATVPYLTLFGLLQHLPVVYIFERSDTLLTLPPAPVAVDYEQMSRASTALAKLSEAGLLRREEFFQLIPNLAHNERDFFASLLEDLEDHVGLSAFGQLMLDNTEAAKSTVLVSPAVQAMLDGLRGRRLEIFARYLDKVAQPGWRKSHKHAFSQTDLDIYKPGNVAWRLGCFLRGSKVYLAEFWFDHNAYENEAPQCREHNYNLKDFAPPSYPETDRADEAEDIVTALIEENERLREENESLEMMVLGAQDKQEKRAHAGEQLETLRRRVADLEALLAKSTTPRQIEQVPQAAKQIEVLQRQLAIAKVENALFLVHAAEKLELRKRSWWRRALRL